MAILKLTYHVTDIMVEWRTWVRFPHWSVPRAWAVQCYRGPEDSAESVLVE
jgi:hypothetical protein